MSKRNVYETAVMLWGVDSQVKMLFEEMAELTQAVCKYFRKPSSETFTHINEEMADVEIMLAQMRVMFGNEATDRYKAKKLARLEGLVNDESARQVKE